MRECISFHIGQAGIQVGNSVWELYCIEHGISWDGFQEDDGKSCGDDSYKAFFHESRPGKFQPRALLIDLEPGISDLLHAGKSRELFSPRQMISGKEDAANLFPRGRYTVGKDIIDLVVDRTGKMIDKCDGLQGFLLFHSFGGGTGSGFTALLMEKLKEEYGKIPIHQIPIYPSPKMTSGVVDPYNALLHTHATMDLTDCCFMMDNEATYGICKNLEIETPSFRHINRLIAQVVSSMTSSLRFEGNLNVDFSDFQTNLVPYPRIHFPLVSYAPHVPAHKAYHQDYTVDDITSACFEPGSQMLACDCRTGKYIASALLYRGDATPLEVAEAVQKVKGDKNIEFVDWSPAGFKVGMNYEPPSFVPDGDLSRTKTSLCAISNVTSVAEVWKRLNRKFDAMFRKRAFVHWYVGEGMEEAEMIEARHDLASLELDYQEMDISSVSYSTSPEY